jgi:hypothetical protein
MLVGMKVNAFLLCFLLTLSNLNSFLSLSTTPPCQLSVRGIPSSAEEPIPKLGTEQNRMEFPEKKISLTKRQQNNLTK